MHWLFLILASVCEICWLYCIRYMNQLSINELLSLEVFSKDDGWLAVVSIVGYAGFGVANVILFSAALKKIPASAGFGIWTGLAILGNTVIDHWVLGVDFSMLQGVFAFLLLAGILGLRISTIKNQGSVH
jgi:quaternary ammonium compound-resistance protein SugE